MLTIRAEQIGDFKQVHHVITEAFKTAEHSDGNEAELVNKLRESLSFIPELSLVAIADDIIVGHILFTKAYVNTTTVLARPIIRIAGISKSGHRTGINPTRAQNCTKTGLPLFRRSWTRKILP